MNHAPLIRLKSELALQGKVELGLVRWLELLQGLSPSTDVSKEGGIIKIFDEWGKKKWFFQRVVFHPQAYRLCCETFACAYLKIGVTRHKYLRDIIPQLSCWSLLYIFIAKTGIQKWGGPRVAGNFNCPLLLLEVAGMLPFLDKELPNSADATALALLLSEEELDSLQSTLDSHGHVISLAISIKSLLAGNCPGMRFADSQINSKWFLDKAWRNIRRSGIRHIRAVEGAQPPDFIKSYAESEVEEVPASLAAMSVEYYHLLVKQQASEDSKNLARNLTEKIVSKVEPSYRMKLERWLNLHINLEKKNGN